MKRTRISSCLFCVIAMTLAGCASARRSCTPAHIGGAPGHYLGQTPPGMTPELFAPGVVNTEAIELNGVLSPDGREFFFTRIVDDVFTMHRRVVKNGRWSDPRPFSVYANGEKATAVDMAYSPDGKLLYFLGRGSTDLVGGDNNPQYQTSYQTQNAQSYYGCFDMSGNLWEWCNDWYLSTYYSSSPESNPTGPTSGTDRVLRGGGWAYDTHFCRSVYRYSIAPVAPGNVFGFRCAVGTP